MIDEIVSFFQAIIINALLIAILIVSMEWVKTEVPQNISMMEATTVNERTFQAAVKQVEKETKRRKAAELAEQRAVKQQMLALESEKMRLTQLEIEEIERKRREAEEQRRKAEERRLAQIAFERAERLRKKKEAEEARRRVEKERKQKVVQAELDRQKKKEAERQAQEKASEAKRQTALERQKKAEAKKQVALEKKQREKAVKGSHQTERKQSGKAQKRERQKQNEQKAKQGRINTVTGLIHQKVNGYWFWTRETEHLSCLVKIYLLPGGKVLKVDIINSSGNTAFDNSAIRAIYDASPLPVPADVFDEFRSFTFLFDPDA
jgi:colicin import membrane protein